MSVALNAVIEQDEISGDDRLHYVAERASELAMEALADLEAINLPRPILDSHQGTTNAELIAALQEYTRGVREIQEKAISSGPSGWREVGDWERSLFVQLWTGQKRFSSLSVPGGTCGRTHLELCRALCRSR